MKKSNIDNVIESIKKLNSELEPIIKNIKSEITKESLWTSFSIDKINDMNFKKCKNKAGLYFFQVRFEGGIDEYLESNNIFETIDRAWNEDERGSIPPIVKERFDVLKSKLLKGEWFYFYLGKSNNLEKRIMEHLGTKGSKSTSKLNLYNIKNSLFKNCEFKIKIKELNEFKEEEYYWVISKVEKDLRKKLNPICGK